MDRVDSQTNLGFWEIKKNKIPKFDGMKLRYWGKAKLWKHRTEPSLTRKRIPKIRKNKTRISPEKLNSKFKYYYRQNKTFVLSFHL